MGVQFNPKLAEKPIYQVNSNFGTNIRGIGGFEPGYTGGAGVVEMATNPPKRAVDNLPKAQMIAYNEDLPAQAGRERGVSTWSLIG